MARLIDVDALIMKWNELAKHMARDGYAKIPVDFGTVICELSKAPTVDAVEVVRCRDCKHSTLPSLITQRYGVPGTLTCHNHNSPCNKRNVKGECFCPYGERKDGDGDG